MNDPVLEVRSLTKRFGSFIAVDSLNFELYPGEILGLLGVNGAGKTTAMSMVLGLITPDSGSIRAFGMDMPARRTQILRRINFCSAYTALPSNLLVWQNLDVFAGLYGVRNKKQRISELLEMFEITSLKNMLTGHLSSGETARVNFCKALLNQPDVLLMDEPTASLDPDIADKVRRIIRQVQQERGMAVLYTSHNMRDVEAVCDRVIFMHKGRILYQGTPTEVAERNSERSLEQLFIRVARSGDVECIPSVTDKDKKETS